MRTTRRTSPARTSRLHREAACTLKFCLAMAAMLAPLAALLWMALANVSPDLPQDAVNVVGFGAVVFSCLAAGCLICAACAASDLARR